MQVKEKTIAYLSQVGYYNFFYPDFDKPCTVQPSDEIFAKNAWKSINGFSAYSSLKHPVLWFKD
jgi:hypothetical protein